ncbi:MAG: glycerophosphodiester phosphodiesterase family protein, partial [Prevotella sp.]
DADELYLQSRGSHEKVCVTSHLFRAAPLLGSREVKVVVRNRFGQVQTQTVDVDRAWMSALSAGSHPKVIAHRGYWRRPGAVQNSLAALREAAKAGVYGCELDVQITADGEVIVNHDPHLGGLPIARSNYSQLSKSRLGNGEPVPTLAKYLDEVKKYEKLKIILEIKKQSTDSVEADLVRKAMELVEARGLSSRVQYISFSQFVCDELLRHCKTADVVCLGGNMSPADAKEHGYSGIDYSINVFQRHPEWVDEAHKLGLTVNIWTPDTEEQLKFALTFHPDFITTDSPEDAKRLSTKF